MFFASTHIPTAEAAKYILKLCRHFAHKVPAEFTEHDGQVRFAQGQCVMNAEPQGLSIYLQSPQEDGIRAMQFIIDDHLQRFVRFETLSYQWTAEVPPAQLPALDALARQPAQAPTGSAA